MLEVTNLFVLLVFIHFVSDWVFQTHYEAMNKHNNARVRARHCFTYTLFFIPCLWIYSDLINVAICAAILFISHFIEDTYIPVYLWAKYIRRVPEAQTRKGFAEWIQTSLGKILMITIDQIIHILFLWIVAVFVIWN